MLHQSGKLRVLFSRKVLKQSEITCCSEILHNILKIFRNTHIHFILKTLLKGKFWFPLTWKEQKNVSFAFTDNVLFICIFYETRADYLLMKYWIYYCLPNNMMCMFRNKMNKCKIVNYYIFCNYIVALFFKKS